VTRTTTPEREAWSYLNEIRGKRPTDAVAVQYMARHYFRDNPADLTEYERLVAEGMDQIRTKNQEKQQ
jgi:succinate dehydrogenase flavin-adding protein (antitoxin of CptAB toxin-antitoxin module)